MTKRKKRKQGGNSPAKPAPPVTKAKLSGRQFTLAIIAVSVVFLLVACLLAFRGGMMYAKGTLVADEVRIEFPRRGTTLVKVNGRPDKATYLLAANHLWADIGLIVQPKKQVKITAS